MTSLNFMSFIYLIADFAQAALLSLFRFHGKWPKTELTALTVPSNYASLKLVSMFHTSLFTKIWALERVWLSDFLWFAGAECLSEWAAANYSWLFLPRYLWAYMIYSPDFTAKASASTSNYFYCRMVVPHIKFVDTHLLRWAFNDFRHGALHHPWLHYLGYILNSHTTRWRLTLR